MTGEPLSRRHLEAVEAVTGAGSLRAGIESNSRLKPLSKGRLASRGSSFSREQMPLFLIHALMGLPALAEVDVGSQKPARILSLLPGFLEPHVRVGAQEA